MSLILLKVPLVLSDLVSSDFAHEEEVHPCQMMANEDMDELDGEVDNPKHYMPFYYTKIGYFTFNPREVLYLHEEEMLLNGMSTKCTYIQYKDSDTRCFRLAISPEEFIRLITPYYTGKYSPIIIHISALN